MYLDKDVNATLIEDPFGKIRTALSGEQVEIVVPARMVKILEIENSLKHFSQNDLDVILTVVKALNEKYTI